MKLTITIAVLASVNAALAQVAAWGQCGGNGYTGSTTCVSGHCCTYSNAWYSQCLPGSCGGGGVTTTAVRTTTTTMRATTTTTSARGSATTFCGQYDLITSTNGYNVINNLWGRDSATSGSQCTWYNGISGSGVSWGTSWTWAGGENNVKSYPYAGRNFSPRIVSQISSLPTSFSWSYSGNNIRANVAYDLFTSAVSTTPTYTGDYELMIWMAQLGGVFPISATGSPVATVTLAGQSWRLYYGLNGNMKVYSFVYANGVLNNFSGDVKVFWNYLVSNWGYPASSQYLTTFQAGTEPFTGGPATFTVSQFSAAVN